MSDLIVPAFKQGDYTRGNGYKIPRVRLGQSGSIYGTPTSASDLLN